jgi:hypothetical protein
MMAARTAALFILLCSAPVRGWAQSPLPPDPAQQRGAMKIGPVSLSPRIELRNVGIDSNVFNDAEAPKEDFTATIRPALDAVLRFGVARLVYRSSLDAVYFHEYESERSINRFGEVRAEARLDRIVPFVSLAGLATSDRPNNEIDLRASRTVRTLTGGVAAAVLPTTAVVATVKRETFTYEAGQRFRDVDLAEQLNNRRDSYDVGVRYAMTPLTTLVVTYGHEDTRFALSPDRDSESVRYMSRLEFDPDALLGGTASVGYRKFTPVDPALAPFRGVVAQVTLRYASESRTQVAIQIGRDLDYSFEEDQPYYVTTGGTVTVTQRIGGPIDVQLVAGRERLRYERRTGVDADGDGAIDNTTTAAAGIGYWFGETARLGVNVEFTRRDADQTGRSYDRRRILSSLTYGF